MSGALDWARDGRDWPNRAASRFVTAGDTRWHVQIMGSGPPLLLVHGTGASTHSWRRLAPLLARRHTVIAPDLPGHAFTGSLPGPHSIAAMGKALAALLAALEYSAAAAIGHSAGAAIVIRMTLDGQLAPRMLVSLDGALLPWRGLPAFLFGPLARLLVANRFVPRFFAGRAADPAVLARLIDSTGSRLEHEDVVLYRRLASNPVHVAGALAMMADWDLTALQRDLPRLRVPLLALHGDRDRMVSGEEFARVAALVPGIEAVTLAGLGHLPHEEDPEKCDALIRRFESRIRRDAGHADHL